MATFEGWAVVELLGHRVRYGRVSEVTMFGETMCQVTMPTEPATVEWYSGKALYGIRPASEDAIRAYHAPRRELSAPSSVTEHTSAGHRRAFEEQDAGDDDPDLDDTAEPECMACGEPLGDEFVTVDAHGKRELWHRECADDAAYPVVAASVDPAAPEPIVGGS